MVGFGHGAGKPQKTQKPPENHRRHRSATENTEGRGVGARHCLALFCGRTPITCHCEPPQAPKQSPSRLRETASAATPPRSDITALLWKAGASRRRATSQAVGAVSTAAEATITCHCEPPQAAKQSPSWPRETASAATPPRSNITASLWKAASRRRATSQAVGAVSTAAEAPITCHCEPPRAAKQSPSQLRETVSAATPPRSDITASLWKAASRRRATSQAVGAVSTAAEAPITCHCEPPQAAKQSPFRPRRGAASAATPPRSDITALLWKAGANRRRATSQAVGAVSTAAEAVTTCHR